MLADLLCEGLLCLLLTEGKALLSHRSVRVTLVALQDMMLPVEAELIWAQIDVAEILLLIFSEYSAEGRNTRNIDHGKSSIEKVSTWLIGV